MKKNDICRVLGFILSFQLKLSHLLITILIFGALSCGKKNKEVIAESKYDKSALQFAASYLGKGSIVDVNKDSTYYLCTIISDQQMTFAVLSYERELILPKQRIRGTVKWQTAESLIVQEHPGVIENKSSQPSDYTRIIDLKKKN